MSEESKTLPLYPKALLQQHNSKNDCWVSVNYRKIYDATDFIRQNPSMSQAILEYAGKDIAQALKDKVFNKQTTAAYEILKDSNLVGYLATEEEERKLLTNEKHTVEVKLCDSDLTKFVKVLPSEEKLLVRTDFRNDLQKHKFLDLNKPLLKQLWNSNFTREFYIDQIHRPRHYGRGSAVLFGNFLEPLSKTAWWVVPMLWYPLVFYFLAKAAKNLSAPLVIALFIFGIFVWTLVEYSLHRFLFHVDNHLPESTVVFTLHFLLHGFHHYLPMDKYRLVLPPALFIVLCTPIYKLVFLMFPYYWACAGFAGGVFGYIGYDMTHYFLHHHKLPPFMRKLKKYHLEHHYKNYELGYGVTSWFWDKVFGTYLGSDAPVAKMKYQ
ncbi:HDL434Wp [Eremothecium sinecaudum]|uniref:Ceramide very long chain fatty acid hydroxylase n=1 Tax=Eremothecium sinecaudum TaxID=45286 RepID=A0A109UYS7_9SACH|nr:HDL434Wp [Eremothecium sinecaudum]AMD20310.1 HDL434Wp [Eremothecium sinecaudum]